MEVQHKFKPVVEFLNISVRKQCRCHVVLNLQNLNPLVVIVFIAMITALRPSISLADTYNIPAIETHQCSRSSHNLISGFWANEQEALNEYGRQALVKYPTLVDWYFFESNPPGFEHCEAHNQSYTGFSPPDDGISGYHDVGYGCSYRSASGTVTVGSGPGLFNWDGRSYYFCSVNGELPKNILSGPKCGDPVAVLTGTLVESEIDYQSQTLSFQRNYTSAGSDANRVVGAFWQHSFDRKISMTWDEAVIAVAYREDGRMLVFREVANTNDWSPDADVPDRLQRIEGSNGLTSGWQFISASDNSIETYNADGKLIAIAKLNGLIQTLTYDAKGYLQKIEDSEGKTLTFTNDNMGRLSSMTDPNGGVYQYTYDVNNNLISVTYPDSSSKQYRYENPNFPHALTGLVDEKGQLFSTWEYDTNRRVLSSKQINDVGQTTFDYTYIDDTNDPRATVTNELGKQTTYHYTTIHGVRKVTQVEGHQSANCAAANQSYTYDANGFKDEVTDWEGNVTDYDHDARGLEVQRIEAKGTPQQRIITTQWHPDFRLPTKITEPDRVINFSYDPQGLLLERKETPVP